MSWKDASGPCMLLCWCLTVQLQAQGLHGGMNIPRCMQVAEQRNMAASGATSLF